jgi:hypothetical protein
VNAPIRTTDPAFYGFNGPSLLAQVPATIPWRGWGLDADWEDFRNYSEQRLLGFRNWRTSWWAHWAELASNIWPERYHWLVTPNTMTRGAPINQNVVDSTPSQAVEVAAAGMMDGLVSPTKTWVVFQPKGKKVEIDTDGQQWLDDLKDAFYDVCAASNFYDAVHMMFTDEIVFGSAPVVIYEHRDQVINLQNPCAGEYYLEASPDYSTLSLYREFTQTAMQIVQRFGPEAVQNTVVGDLWNEKGANLSTEYIVAHAIEPNFPAATNGQNKKLGVVPGGFPYRELYWLRGINTPQPLSFRGFRERPFMSPLWSIRSNDPYGRSQGMKALPDILQLHRMTMRYAEVVEKGVRPPMLADVTMKNEPSSQLPGRVTFVPNLGKDSGMRTMYTVEPTFLQFMEATIERLQNRIERWFYNDVFMMISQMEGVQPRNELELTERRGEKLLRLGPVIERNLRELASAVNRIIAIMQRRGLIRPMPQSLARMQIEIKFVSKLALVQQAAATAGMERTLSMAGRMEAAMPGTLDNVNKDKFIHDYGEKLEFPANLWNTDQERDDLRKQRAQQQQKAEAAQLATHTAPAMADAAQTLSETPTGGGINALQMMLGNGGMPMTGGGAA